MIDSINENDDTDKETRQLEIELLRRYMSRVAKYQRTELNDIERELLTDDANSYSEIVHSK